MGNNMNSVDIIIVNWNGLHHLHNCLPALKKQTWLPDRVIIVDNGSDDGSCSWIKEHHSWVEVVCLGKNLGFTGANIVGFERSSGDYVVLLNNDTLPSPTWLEELVKAADGHPEVGIVASTMLRWESDLIDTAGDECTMAGTGVKVNTGLDVSAIHDGYVFGACAGAALYKRVMLDQVGFLDPDYFLSQEDIDLSFRAQLCGWKVWLASRAYVYHRVAATRGKLSPIVVYHGAKNNEATYWKNMPTGLLFKTFPHRFAQSLFSFVNVGLKQRMLIPFIKGKIHALLSMPKTLKKRKKNISMQSVSNDYIYNILTPIWTTEYLFKRKRIRDEYHSTAVTAQIEKSI